MRHTNVNSSNVCGMMRIHLGRIEKVLNALFIEGYDWTFEGFDSDANYIRCIGGAEYGGNVEILFPSI